MKKTLIIIFLILTLASSIIAGTLAVYNVNLGGIAEGSVVAKEFILEEEESADTFAYNVKIAPTETVEFTFAIRNFRKDIVSEVPISSDITVYIDGAENKKPIGPLQYTVYEVDSLGKEIKTINNISGIGLNNVLNGQIDFTEIFPLNSVGQTKYYKVKIFWPSTAGDNNFKGNEFGSRVRINVTGKQITDTITNNNYYDKVDISFTKTGDTKFLFKIKNNSDEDITNGWAMELDNTLKQIFNNMESNKLLDYNKWNILDIANGLNEHVLMPTASGYSSPSFFIGKGEELIYEITVKNKNALKDIDLSSIDYVKLRKPYNVKDITVSFDGTNIDKYNHSYYLHIENKGNNSCVYGWSIQFTTNAVLNANEFVELLSNNNGIYTYKATIPATLDKGEMTYIKSNQKNEVLYSGTETFPDVNTKIIISDVLLDGQSVDYKLP